jgi:CHAT domain-containing protein
LILADDTLSLSDLQQEAIDLEHTRLVSLSACETGVVDIAKGSPDEYVGVPAGFLLAGVPCVLSSLWEASDISTALLMERFYHNHMALRNDIASALREAQLWLKDLTLGQVLEYAEQRYNEVGASDHAGFSSYLASLSILASKDPQAKPFNSPYYWAAFTVNGL